MLCGLKTFIWYQNLTRLVIFIPFLFRVYYNWCSSREKLIANRNQCHILQWITNFRAVGDSQYQRLGRTSLKYQEVIAHVVVPSTISRSPVKLIRAFGKWMGQITLQMCGTSSRLLSWNIKKTVLKPTDFLIKFIYRTRDRELQLSKELEPANSVP